MAVKVSIIIPNRNGAGFLPDCLRSLAGQTCKNFEVVLVDNGSTDGSAVRAEKLFPGIKSIVNRENRGFAAANNQGLEIAGGEYIATLNNDTVADARWMEHLIARAEGAPRVGMWAPKILLYGENRVIDSVGIKIALDGMSRQRGRMETDEGQYDSSEEVLFPSACAALYKRGMLDEVGFFDEDFFAYCEDSDLGMRARLAGWEARSAPEAVVYHKYSGTGGAYSPLKARLVERNHFYVALKNFPPELLLSLPFFTVYRYLLHLAAAAEGKGASSEFAAGVPFTGIVKTVAGAHLEAALNLGGMLQKRKNVQKNRKLSAEDLRRLISKHRLGFMELAFKK